MSSQRGWALAVDFGTTATAAATVSGGQVHMVRIDADDRMPSMVFWRESDGDAGGELLLGDLADRWAALAPECLERAPKRRIGDQFLRLGPAQIPVTVAVGAILGKVRDAAVRERGSAPTELYLTHPARWGADGPEVDQLREAAGVAGLPEPVLMAEPVAAAIHFASAELSVGEFVAVYDLGGGTFDTAVLRRVAGGFDVVGEPGGDEELGGEDFDDRLYRWLGSQLPVEEWRNLRTSRAGGWPQTNRELLREARKAKEHLSRNPDAPVYVPAPVDRDILVNAERLRELIADDIRGTVEVLEQTISGAGLEVSQLAAIYLAGGSSSIPMVAAVISERLGKVPRTLDDPKTVVARGAALASSYAQSEPRPPYPPPGPSRKPPPPESRRPTRSVARSPAASVEPAIRSFASWCSTQARILLTRVRSANLSAQDRVGAAVLLIGLGALVGSACAVLIALSVPIAALVLFARYEAQHSTDRGRPRTPGVPGDRAESQPAAPPRSEGWPAPQTESPPDSVRGRRAAPQTGSQPTSVRGRPAAAAASNTEPGLRDDLTERVRPARASDDAAEPEALPDWPAPSP